MAPKTALPLLLQFLRNYCPTCRPLAERRFHKAACLLRPLGDWL